MKTPDYFFQRSFSHLLNGIRSVAAKVVTILVLAFAALSLQRTDAAVLYGSTASGGPGELYRLDPATGGILQDIGALNDAFGLNYGITGLAFDPFSGLLYGSTANNNPATRAQLVTINPLNGLVTVIGAFNVGNSGTTPSTMSDLSFDPTTGRLYGVGSVGGPQLYSINLLTGQATVIGSTGLTSTSGGGLAISSSGAFYGTPTATRFGTYNSGSGAFTTIANPAKPAGGGAYAALAFDGSGLLYGLNSGPGTPPVTHLVTIDPVTGAVTDIGASVNALDAIAFAPVPEPSTLSLFALLVGGGVLSRRALRK
jgi:hypothetical protein